MSVLLSTDDGVLLTENVAIIKCLTFFTQKAISNYTKHSIMNDELTGTLVMVHPDLKGDPICKQGNVGIIITESFENDYVCVSFRTGEQSYYTHDVLLTLKRPSIIYSDILRNSIALETADFKQLLRISLLVDSGLNKDKRAAMELAISNELIRKYIMHPLTQISPIKQHTLLYQ